jgi:oligopeptide transport system substrate-binding protein
MLEAKERGERNDIHRVSTFGTYYWNFNCSPTLPSGEANPFADPRVRRAFVYATDRQTIASTVKRTGEEPAYTFIPPGSIEGYDPPVGLRFDPQRAREELAAAGWEDRNNDGIPENDKGRPFPVVQMLYSTGADHDDVALVMGRMWEETLGVRTDLVGKESKIYRADLETFNYMVARGGWFGDYGDPTTFLDMHRTNDGQNVRNFSDPAFDDMMARSDLELDPERRLAILRDAEARITGEQVPILTIYHYNWYYMFEPPTTPDGEPNPGGLRNVSTHPRITQYLWELEVVQPDASERGR